MQLKWDGRLRGRARTALLREIAHCAVEYTWDGGGGGIMFKREYDAENYAWALEHLRDEGEITVVYVQRWLRIGYDRATKICNRLVEEGIAEVHNGIYVLEGEA